VPRVGSDEGERAGLGASGAGGGEGGSLRSALRRRRWSNARIQFVSGGGAEGTPTCKTAGRNTEDMSGRQRGGAMSCCVPRIDARFASLQMMDDILGHEMESWRGVIFSS
jgi:hypothetical protein